MTRWLGCAGTVHVRILVPRDGLVMRWLLMHATGLLPLFCSMPRMPRACPAVVHAGRYRAGASFLFDATGLSRGGSRWPLPSRGLFFVRCHGLVSWWFTLAATEPGPVFCSMPRACPVVVHAGRYRAGASFLFDATGLSRGGSRWPLPSRGLFFVRCHGLVPRWFTLAATEPGPLFCS